MIEDNLAFLGELVTRTQVQNSCIPWIKGTHIFFGLWATFKITRLKWSTLYEKMLNIFLYICTEYTLYKQYTMFEYLVWLYELL